jgi:hypothetical protein
LQLWASLLSTRTSPSQARRHHPPVHHPALLLAASSPRAPIGHTTPIIATVGTTRGSRSRSIAKPCARHSKPQTRPTRARLCGPIASTLCPLTRRARLAPWTASISPIKENDRFTATNTRRPIRHTHRHFTCPLPSRPRKYPSQIPSREVAIRFYQDHTEGREVLAQVHKDGHPHKVRSRVCYTEVRSATRRKVLEATMPSGPYRRAAAANGISL